MISYIEIIAWNMNNGNDMQDMGFANYLWVPSFCSLYSRFPLRFTWVDRNFPLFTEFIDSLWQWHSDDGATPAPLSSELVIRKIWAKHSLSVTLNNHTQTKGGEDIHHFHLEIFEFFGLTVHCIEGRMAVSLYWWRENWIYRRNSRCFIAFRSQNREFLRECGIHDWILDGDDSFKDFFTWFNANISNFNILTNEELVEWVNSDYDVFIFGDKRFHFE